MTVRVIRELRIPQELDWKPMPQDLMFSKGLGQIRNALAAELRGYRAAKRGDYSKSRKENERAQSLYEVMLESFLEPGKKSIGNGFEENVIWLSGRAAIAAQNSRDIISQANLILTLKAAERQLRLGFGDLEVIVGQDFEFSLPVNEKRHYWSLEYDQDKLSSKGMHMSNYGGELPWFQTHKFYAKGEGDHLVRATYIETLDHLSPETGLGYAVRDSHEFVIRAQKLVRA